MAILPSGGCINGVHRLHATKTARQRSIMRRTPQVVLDYAREGDAIVGWWWASTDWAATPPK
jgi:hypothetical protein